MQKNNNRGIRFDEKNGILYINNKQALIENIKIISYISKNGANGFVFEGENVLINRKIALKVWTPRFGFDFPDIKRFNAEIQKNAKYNNDKIVQIYSGGRINNYFYAEMEYIDGQTLEDWLKNWSRSFIERIKVLIQILDGIKVVHEGGDYHGDLHTRNILITEEGSVKILDLGTSIFSGKDHSSERESRLLLQTGKKLLEFEMNEYSFLDSTLLKHPQKFPPELVREFLGSLSKIIWSLKYDLASDNKLLLSDLAFHFCKAPIFNLSSFVEYLFENFKEDYQRFLSSLHELLTFIIIVYESKNNEVPFVDNYNDMMSENLEILYETAKNLCLENVGLYLKCFESLKEGLKNE